MLNKKDFIIMACLRSNARETLTKMSRRTQIPVSTIYDRLRAHEATVIRKHTCLLDFEKLGYNARAKVILKVSKEQREEILKYLTTSQHINSLYKINNGYDYLAEFVFRNIKDLEDYLELLEHKFDIRERQVYFIIEDLKQEGFLSDQNLAEIA